MTAPESTARTLAVAVAVALVCALLVTTAVQSLRPRQLAYAEIDRNRAILEAAGLIGIDAEISDRAVVDAFLALEPRQVDLRSGAFVAAGVGELAAGSGGSGTATDAEQETVYLRMGDAGLLGLVLPLHAQGMWSTIEGYLGLDADLNTITGLSFFRHGETPGIGDRIENAAWRAQWVGKRIRDEAGQFRFRISSDPAVAAIYRVDAISGATVTAMAVDRSVQSLFASPGIAAMLTRLHTEPM